MEQDIANGHAVKADTVEELAALTGMPADALAATIERYNELCEGGEDLDYGKDPDYMIPLEAPYYAYFTHVEVCGSSVRLIVNENTQVLREDGSIIPNLYAIGDTCKNSSSLYSSSTFALNTG